jgi:hypothetical protein
MGYATVNRKKLGCAQGLTSPERVTVEMTFSDFGTPVPVSPPPSSEVFNPDNI